MKKRPEPSPAMIEAAKNSPNGWVYQVEGNFAPPEAVPPEAIAGAWKVDEKGIISGDFIPNPNYVPRVEPQPEEE
jgi:hypothetical protein